MDTDSVSSSVLIHMHCGYFLCGYFLESLTQPLYRRRATAAVVRQAALLLRSPV